MPVLQEEEEFGVLLLGLELDQTRALRLADRLGIVVSFLVLGIYVVAAVDAADPTIFTLGHCKQESV